MRFLALAALLVAAPAAGQSLPAGLTPAPPGPFVVDLRGISLGVPQDATFFPPVPGATLIPQRGFGLDAGAYVYRGSLGPARLGLGGRAVLTRATTSTPSATAAAVTTFPDIVVSQRILLGEVSLNFGSAAGWSYISAGAGSGRGTASARGGTAAPAEATAGTAVAAPATEVTTSGTALGVGGGARWFLNPHLGVGFDVRWYRLAGTSVLGASAGLSLK